MKAYRMLQWGQRPRLCDIPTPTPGPGEVRLRVGGNGICQSDLHAMDEWQASPPHLDIALPMTLGHEIAGWIDALGPGVAGLEPGLSCAITSMGCGSCPRCAEGWNNYCLNQRQIYGGGMDGGLAEYIVVRRDCLVPTGRLAPWQAAPLTDAGLSSYHAVKRVSPLLVPGATVVVIGVGGLGHLAVAAIKAISAARVIAIDQRAAALDLAREMGADLGMLAGTADRKAIRAEAGTVDAVLDFVGDGSTIALAAGVIRPLGHIVVVGRGHGAFEFRDHTVPYGAMLSTTFGGSKLELLELMALANAECLPVRIARFPLSRVDEAFERLRRGEIVGRAVIVPDREFASDTLTPAGTPC
jgi:alcohol dehydrogenase, propanol-preferring